MADWVYMNKADQDRNDIDIASPIKYTTVQ